MAHLPTVGPDKGVLWGKGGQFSSGIVISSQNNCCSDRSVLCVARFLHADAGLSKLAGAPDYGLRYIQYDGGK